MTRKRRSNRQSQSSKNDTKKSRTDSNNNGKEEEEEEEEEEKPIPVSILSGFLGSGKTTLLKYILTSKSHNLKIAVIVNDMAELNIDGQTILRASEISKTQKEKGVVTLENGCICCTLRGDLIREIYRIQQLKEFDYVLIESTGIAEPQQVAESFCVDPNSLTLAVVGGDGGDEEEDNAMLWNSARLDTCVTVVDAVNFPRYVSSLKHFKQEFQDGLDVAEEGEGEKSISELMVEQVEFANVILLNKIDLVSDQRQIQTTKKLIQALNPKAQVVCGSYGQIDLEKILNTNLFDMKEASESPGWLVSLKNGMVNAEEGEADEYGVTSFVYRERRPFHPKRLHEFLKQFFCFAEEWCKSTSVTENNNSIKEEEEEEEEEEKRKKLEKKYGCILRSKGTCWIAGRDDHEIGWAQSGRIIQLNPTNAWYCKEWNGYAETEEERMRIEALFRHHVQKNGDYNDNEESLKYEYGDRRQEIVIIGINLKRDAIEDELRSCLLSEQEMKSHSASLPYGTYPDPLQPILIPAQGACNLFVIVRPGQDQHVKIFPGFQLTLQSLALNIKNDDYDERSIKAVKVWLDRSDGIKQGILLATLRPETHEQQSMMSLDLLPCDEDGGEEVTNRRIRVEVVRRKKKTESTTTTTTTSSLTTTTTGENEDYMTMCEVHIMGKVEPLPYSEDNGFGGDVGDDDDDDDELDCEDGTCPAGAAA